MLHKQTSRSKSEARLLRVPSRLIPSTVTQHLHREEPPLLRSELPCNSVKRPSLPKCSNGNVLHLRRPLPQPQQWNFPYIHTTRRRPNTERNVAGSLCHHWMGLLAAAIYCMCHWGTNLMKMTSWMMALQHFGLLGTSGVSKASENTRRSTAYCTTFMRNSSTDG